MLQKIAFVLVLVGLLSPQTAFAADANVGNEVVNSADSTLTRTGGGTAANPYKLQLNLGNANTWTAAQTINNTLNANGTVNLGDGGDPLTISSSTVNLSAAGNATVSVQDNNALALDLQEGTNNYFAISTTNGVEKVELGNATTNPSFNFLGGGVVTITSDLAVNGGDITSTATTGNILNSSVLTVNAFGSATNVSIGASTGTTTINNATISLPNATFVDGSGAGAAFQSVTSGGGYGSTGVNLSSTGDVMANGNLVIDGSATVNGVVTLPALSTASGDAICLNSSDQLIKCSAGGALSLQGAYDGGNTIDTSNNRDISLNLLDTLTDSSFTVTTQSGAAGSSKFSLADGAGSVAAPQLVLIENNDSDASIASGVKIQSASGGITTAVDVSDPEISTALSFGANDISGTNLSITGSSGNVSSAGDIAANGGDLTTFASTATLFNTNVSTGNLFGSATTVTIGANFGTLNLRPSTISMANATTISANSANAQFDSSSIGGGYGVSGTTMSSNGNIQSNGSITIDGPSTLTGNVTSSGDIAINGGDLTSTASTASVFNNNVTTLNVGGAASTISIGGSSGTTTVNNDLTIASGKTVTANGAVSLSPDSTNDITFNTDSDSNLVITGLQTVAGDGLCIDASDNVVKCSGTPSDQRIKNNITTLSDSLQKVLRLRGVRYNLIAEPKTAIGNHIGFIAQELEKEYPELVKTDDNGLKTVDYEKVTAILVESTKDQQKQIEDMKKEIELLKVLIQKK